MVCDRLPTSCVSMVPGLNSVFSAVLETPFCPVSVNCGNMSARAVRMSALAAISSASVLATSGRRASNSLGRPAATSGNGSLVSVSAVMAISSGGRPTRMPSAFRSCSNRLCRPGMEARIPATSASCWLTSNCELVPAARRARNAVRISVASRRLRRATASSSWYSRAVK